MPNPTTTIVCLCECVALRPGLALPRTGMANRETESGKVEDALSLRDEHMICYLRFS